MKSIIEFLEARIADDEGRPYRDAEAMAESCRADGMPDTTAEEVLAGWLELAEAGTRFPWSRMLAECKAKRAIMGLHQPHDHGGEHGDAVFCSECQWDRGDDSPRIDNQPADESFGSNPCKTLTILAAVYEGHPDYRPEWKAP